MAESNNLGNLWYTLDIDDKTKTTLPDIVNRIKEQLDAGLKSVSIGSLTLDPKAAEQLVKQISDAAKNASATITISADTATAAAQIQQIAQSLKLNPSLDVSVIQQELSKKPFDIKIQCPASEVSALISSLGEKLNGKSVKISVSPAMDKSSVDTLRNEITSRLDKASIKLKNFSFQISAREAANEIQRQLATTPIEVQLATKALNVMAEVKNIALSPESITQLMTQINTSLAGQSAKLGKVDTSELQAALASAIAKSIEVAKPTIMQRIREALTGGVQKIKLDVDAHTLAKNFANALKNSNLKIDNINLSTRGMISDIKNALKKEKFTIDIAVNKMQVATAVQEALKRAGYQNAFNYSASDARMDRNAREAEIAAARLAREQARANKAHLDAERAATRNANAHNRLTREVSNTTLATNALGNVLGNVFSVYAIKNFAQEIINVGGELEKMKMAMGSIMGDTYKADTIFKQVSDLSMVSPFDVQDLVTYTKQLNAFGIQYNELYDTTKRLSDIAAAVGVSFGRIAYEFGQTSARGWLDGRELRMFANSGIPLLQKLSEMYTKDMGKIVTPGEVREMITKRLVSFEDVRKVLWQLTDEGGEFYQMQEVMAESLSAKWRNLANDWNLMLGSIAESGVGSILKRVAESLMVLVENWRSFSAAIAPVVGALTVYKVAQALATKQTMAATVAQRSFGEALKLSGQYIQSSIGKFVKNPFNWVAIGATIAAAAIGKYMEKLQQAQDRIQAVENKANEGYRNIKQFMSSAFEVPPVNDTEFKQSIKEMTKYIKDYAPNAGEILTGVEKIDTLKGKYDALKESITNLADSYEWLIVMKEAFNNSNNATDGAFDESMLENLQDVQTEYEALDQYIKNLIRTNGIAVDKLLESARGASADFAKAVTNENGELKSHQTQLRTLILDYQELFRAMAPDKESSLSAGSFSWLDSRLLDNFSTLKSYIDKFNESVEVADKDIKLFADDFEEIELPRLMKDFKGFDALSPENRKVAVAMMVTANLQDKIHNPYARQLLYNELVKRDLMVMPSVADDKRDTPEPKKDDEKKDKQLEVWKERFRLIKEAYNEYKKWLKLYNDEQKAIDKTKENPMFASLNVNPAELRKNLEELNSQINEATHQRREFKIQVGAQVFNVDYDQLKEEAEKATNLLKETLEKDASNFNLFKKFVEAGADESFAREIAYGSKAVWDEVSDKWASQLYSMLLDKTGDVNLSYGISFDMAEEEAKKFFGSHGDNGEMFALWKATKDRIEKTGIDFYSNLASSMENMSTIENRIKAIEKLRDEAIARLGEDADPVLVASINSMYNEQIGKLKQEFFEGSEVFKKLTQDTTNYGVAKLAQLREFAKSIKEAMDQGEVRKDQNGNLIRRFTIDGNEYEAAEKVYDDIIKKIAQLEKKSQSATESFKKMWEWISGKKDADGTKKTFADIAKDMQFAFSTLSDTASQIGQLFGSDTRAGKTANAIGGIFNGMSSISAGIDAFSSDWLTGTNKILQGINSSVQAIQGLIPEDGNAKIVEALHQTKDAFEKSIGNLSSIMKTQNINDAYESYLKMQKNRDDLMKVTQSSIADSASKYRDKFFITAQRNYHSIGYYVDRYLSSGDWSRISSEIGKPIQKAADLFNLGSQDWYNLMASLPDIWQKIQNAITADSDNPAGGSLIDDIIEYSNMWQKAQEETAAWAEYTTGVAFADVRSGFLSLAQDLSSTWSDFTDSFEEQMFNSLINQKALNRLGNEQDGILADYYKLFAQYSASDGQLTQAEIDELRRKYEEIARIVQQIQDEAKTESGWDGGNESGNLTSSISGTTEDTAEIIAAYLNGVRGDVALNRTMLEQIAVTQFPMLNATAAAQLVQLSMQTEYLRQINETNAAMQMAVESIDDRFRKVVDVDRVRIS